MTNRRRLLLACPHGFCAGVKRAVEIIEATLARFPPPVYCLKEIVHNRQVVGDLAGRGVVFVNDIVDVPAGSIVLFSAHGIPPAVREAAAAHGLRAIDATCPFVSKVHSEVRRYARDGYTIFLIGKRNHDEILGVAGEAPERVVIVEGEAEARSVTIEDPARVAAVTQTTLSVDDAARVMNVLRSRFPALDTPPKSDICYATQNRQRAVQAVARESDFVLVLGSPNSSNSNRLVEVARTTGTPATLVPDAGTLDAMELDGVRTLGLTAGASTPEDFVNGVIERLQACGFGPVEDVTVAEEQIDFALPRELMSDP